MKAAVTSLQKRMLEMAGQLVPKENIDKDDKDISSSSSDSEDEDVDYRIRRDDRKDKVGMCGQDSGQDGETVSYQ